MRRAGIVLLALAAACASDGQARGPVLHDLDGVARRPLETGDAKASVLVFITTDCPIANSYAPEINRIVAEHAGDPVRFVLAHVDPDVTPERAREHARAYALAAPIVLDRDHALVRRTGATVTPEAVVIAPDGTAAYRGRIDNLYADLGTRRPRATVRDLRAALAAVLAGDPAPARRTEAVGCLIPSLPERRG